MPRDDELADDDRWALRTLVDLMELRGPENAVKLLDVDERWAVRQAVGRVLKALDA